MEHEFPLLDKQQEQIRELEDYVQGTDVAPLQSRLLACTDLFTDEQSGWRFGCPFAEPQRLKG